MTGAYFPNPDCLEGYDGETSSNQPRSRSELLMAADRVGPIGFLYISEAEFRLIRKEVGLGYKWQGVRLNISRG